MNSSATNRCVFENATPKARNGRGTWLVAIVLTASACGAPAATPGPAQRQATQLGSTTTAGVLGTSGTLPVAGSISSTGLPPLTGVAGAKPAPNSTFPLATAGVAAPNPTAPMTTGTAPLPRAGTAALPPMAAVGAPPPAAGGAPAPSGPPLAATGDCSGATIAPLAGDYSANGPLPTQTVNNTGPMGQYTVVRPMALGANGTKHPIVTWGNGITTDPSFYPGLLGAIASNGFVVIASNSTTVTPDLMVQGLDWMIMQNGAAGEYQGKLNPKCLVSVGYSLGGGGAVGAGAHANIVATVSMHGVSGASNALHAPLLLLTAETDTVCVPAVMVTPTFDLSAVQTFYGTITSAADSGAQGHLIPVDGALALITPPALNMAERAAVVAWLRLWVYNDEGAKKYFYPDDCILCKAPWGKAQRKMWH